MDAHNNMPADSHKPATSVPATEAQREIWISSQMGIGASCAYNISITLRLLGSIDLNALERAVHEVAGRHEALWARFSPDGVLMMRGDQHRRTIPLFDLRNSSAEERIRTIDELLSGEVSVPFDLKIGPLWRAKIVIISSQESRLIFSAHHIVCDGWSVNILAREMGICYSAYRNAKEPVLKNAESYFSYAEGQNAFLQTPRAAEVHDYWVRQFSGPLPTLELPLDNLRPSGRTYNASCKCRDLDTRLIEKIKKQAAAAGSSPFSVLLGAFAGLLQRLSGNEDIVIGVPAAAQSFSGNPTLVGHCVSMLPIRVTTESAVSFANLVTSLQDKLLDSYDHYEFTFGSLIKSLRIQRDPNRIPLMPVGFTYSKMQTSEELGFAGLHASNATNKRSFETFEIYAMAQERPDGLQLMWQFNSDLFHEETIERWLNEYEVLLRGAMDAPSCAVQSLPLLTEDERVALLKKWNATERPYPAEGTVVDMFEKCAQLFPESKAVECRGQSLTYHELDVRSTILSTRLIQLGATVETTIAVCLERSMDMVTALMAVLKAGAAYVPIDPTFPDERISFILRDSGAFGLVTQSNLGPRFRSENIPMTFMDESMPLGASAPSLRRNNASPNNLAYIIYTSGSTGKPKGVEICHRSLSNFLCAMQEKPGIGPTDSLLSVTTISFDIAGLELLLPLTVGARVLIAESEIVADGRRLAESMRSYRPTIMQATPSTWNMLLESGWRDGKGMTILCGGEAMSRTLADRLIGTGAMVWNMYGPTETTIWSALGRVETGRVAPPIGYPIANTQLYVLADDLSPVPMGVAGELYIGGLGLARGYHHRPELTKEKFIMNPFAHLHDTKGESRMYKTGDLARRLSDGSIIVLGRSDFQVKIRGFRIELGEIEATLLEHPAVRECVVCDRAAPSGAKDLIAYIVFRDSMTAPVDLLFAWLRAKLPFYMLPAQFVFLPSVPRLSNGKINRAALPEPNHDRPQLTMNYVAPHGDMEHSLASIWGAVLGIKKFGVLDNFFDLGGHSMALASVHLKVQELFKCTIEMVSLFEHPTIRALAEYLQKEHKDVILKSAIEDRANRQKATMAKLRRNARP